MQKRFLNWAKYFSILVLIRFALLIFLPKDYKVIPFQTRASTQYWNLPTGSNIGYTLVSAKGEKKPFPIIYLHGGPGGCVSDKTIQQLSPLAEAGFDLYFYDQIGSGHSDRLENIADYTLERHQNDLAAIIKEIGTEKVILIGHSWGAVLAALFVANHQDEIEKIIFTGPGPIPPIRQELAKLKAPDSLNLKPPPYTNQQGNIRAQNIRSKATQKWAYMSGKKLATDDEADDFAAYLFSEVNKSAVKDPTLISKAKGGVGYYAHIMTLKHYFAASDQRTKIKNATIPILVMRGQYDNQKWGFTQEYLESFANHQLIIIPEAGHFIEYEQPKLYLQNIRDFLNQ